MRITGLPSVKMAGSTVGLAGAQLGIHAQLADLAGDEVAILPARVQNYNLRRMVQTSMVASVRLLLGVGLLELIAAIEHLERAIFFSRELDPFTFADFLHVGDE